jgi:hypothetical protein
MPDPQEFWHCLNTLAGTLVPDDSVLAAQHQEAIMRDYVAASSDGQRMMRATLVAVHAALGQLSDELRNPRV